VHETLVYLILFLSNPYIHDAMIKWIKNRLSQEAAANEVEDTPDEVEETFAPVSVRVKPAVPLKPADSYVAGYNVDDAKIGVDNDYDTTVTKIITTGVDPYNTGAIDLSTVEKCAPEKQVHSSLPVTMAVKIIIETNTKKGAINDYELWGYIEGSDYRAFGDAWFDVIDDLRRNDPSWDPD